MSNDEEYKVGTSFNQICPECGVGNPEKAENCLLCDRDLSETVLFIEDEFYDIELTDHYFVEYRKNFYRTRRTGKVKKFDLEKMVKIEFGHPIKRFIFEYEGKKEVYALREENYNAMKDALEELEIIPPE